MQYSVDAAKVYNNFSGLKQIKALENHDKSMAIEEVAKQLESVFLNMMLKSMREANSAFKSDLFGSDQTEFYEEMLDQQMSVSLSQQSGLGLTEALVRQLRDMYHLDKKAEDKQLDFTKIHRADLPVKGKPVYSSPQEFIQAILPDVTFVANELGVDPRVLASQAALETGWGKSIMRNSDGSSSHNLFGIKADSRWENERVSVNTLEYRNGIAQKERASFRSYSSFRESLKDYAQFLKTNPRYNNALENASNPARYTQELQKAGYATDPQYSNKIMRIFSSDLMNQAIKE